jgi:hypothetical protein
MKKQTLEELIAKYNKQWNKYGMGSVISYSQVVAELEKVKEEMKQEQSQKKENQSLEEFINSQPYYGHCTPEYLEGIEVGAKWQEEQAKEMEKEQRGYSEEEVRLAYFQGEKDSYVKGGQTKEMEDEFIQSLKQTKQQEQ